MSGAVRKIVMTKNALGMDSNVWLYTKLYNAINAPFIVLSVINFTEFIAPVQQSKFY